MKLFKNLKNWGPVGDLAMFGLLIWVYLSAILSKDVPLEQGPFSVLLGFLHPNFHVIPYTLITLFFTYLYYTLAYDQGGYGGIKFRCQDGIVKESLPFSKSRGYGRWQGFYYSVFWISILALLYNLIFAVYAAAPGAFPSDSVSAWFFASHHLIAVYHKLSATGGHAYPAAILTWLPGRIFLRQILLSMNIVYTRHWYGGAETEKEEQVAEELAKIALIQSNGWWWTRPWQ